MRDNLLARMKAEDWDHSLRTDLTSAFHTTKAAMMGMMRARWGRVVNMTSVVGITGNAGQANYAAAKAGLIGFTKSIAKEIGSRNVTVNAVAPGYVRTEHVDVRGLFTRNWIASVGIGAVTAIFLWRNVITNSSATPRPHGAYFTFELVWRGVGYGTIDCGPGYDVVHTKRHSTYKLRHCERHLIH